MARKIIESVLDDIDGTEGAETVAFSYAGTSYEIDLSKDNRKALEKALEPYISAGRTTSNRRSSSPARSKSNASELAAIRAWAKDNNLEVSERGRISAEVRQAYEAAH